MVASTPPPTDAERLSALLEEAEQLKHQGKYEQALDTLHRVLSEDPANVTALEEVAENEIFLERYDRARAAAKRAVELRGDSASGHYVLGFLATLKEDWKTALQELQMANKIRPNDPETLRCLGWTLFNSENRVQGVVTLERSLNLDPENAMSLCDLGVCYLHLKNYGKAHTLFIRALELDPQNERAKECVDAVARLKTRYERG